LAALGFSGWCALYSAALLNWGACRALVGHAQGGCFALTLTLAGVAARRYQESLPKPADPLALASLLTTGQITALLERRMARREYRVEPSQGREIELGFGLRAINTGRTILFETARWQESVVDLEHVQITEANRVAAAADLAVVVGVGAADEAARSFVKSHPVRLLLGHELQDMVDGKD
jgi:hypothetical protein